MTTALVEVIPVPRTGDDQTIEALVSLREQFTIGAVIDESADAIKERLRQAYLSAMEAGVIRRINICIEQPENYDQTAKLYRWTYDFGQHSLIAVYDPQAGTTQVLIDGGIALDNSSPRNPILVIGEGHWLRAIGQYFHNLERQRAGALAEAEHKARLDEERRRQELIALATRRI